MKIIKNIKITVTLILLSAMTFSCSDDVFEIPQKGVLELESFYANADDDDALSAMASIYKNVFTGVRGATTWYIPINALSDDCYAGSAFTDSDNMQQFANYNIVTTNSTVKTLYQNYYRLIYWCNLIILKIEPTTDVKKQVIAEAKAIRAFCHMDLIRLWGTPVLVEGIVSSSESSNTPNTPASETWASVERDLNDAISALPTKSGIGGQEAIGGRLTSHAARALLGKAQMYQGKTAEAATTFKSIINSGLYDLVPNIEDIYRPAADFSAEYMWEFNAAEGATNYSDQGDMRTAYMGWRADNVDSDGAGLVAATWGFGAVTANFAQFLLNHDGGKSARWKTFVADYEDILDMGSTGVWAPPVQNNEGYFRLARVPRKVDLYTTVIAWAAAARTRANEPWIRYSEVLLLHAEAQLASGDGDGSGLAALNKVRTRSGLSALGSYTLQDVKDEKRAEMFFEGERYFDLVRWGDAPTVLANKGKTWYSFYGYNEGTTNWNVTSMSGPGTGWQDKYKLLPFPADELTANPALQQNPGW